MAQTTTNYGLLKPESTDSYNHLIYDNPNMDTIDAAMKANADASVASATCIKSGTTHTITRINTSANVFKFTATGDWITGDTMIVDGVTVTPYLMTGEALKTGAYLINSEVIIALQGTRATVLSNQSEAGTTYFDDTNVPFTANNVEDAIEELTDAANINYSAGVSVKDKIDNLIKISDVTDTTDGGGRILLNTAIATTDNILNVIPLDQGSIYTRICKRYASETSTTVWIRFEDASGTALANTELKFRVFHL